MRSQCALYVDAGYLLAASATRVTGTSLRSGVDVDNGALITSLIAQAEVDSGMPLLRVNWYDSGNRAGGLPDFFQQQIGLMPKVKLRLGRRSLSGEQKGVDRHIGLDLAAHGRSRVVDVMYLVSGDDDLTEAVEEAQNHGVQVQLIVVPNHASRPMSVAKHLQQAADGVLLADGAAIDAAVRRRSIPAELAPADLAPPAAVPESPGHTEEAPESGATPANAEPPSPDHPASVPSPSILAGKKSTGLVPPPPAATSTVAWSSDAAGSHQSSEGIEISSAQIDAVARQVIDGWCKAASPEMLARLRSEAPIIPGDLDRALLVDLSNVSGVYDIPDSARFELRERFWVLVERIKLA